MEGAQVELKGLLGVWGGLHFRCAILSFHQWLLGPSPCFFLGRERPASGFQLRESSPFSFFLASSLSFPFSPLGGPGESTSHFQYLMRTVAKDATCLSELCLAH